MTLNTDKILATLKNKVVYGVNKMGIVLKLVKTNQPTPQNKPPRTAPSLPESSLYLPYLSPMYNILS
jgi:hypothetical protein